MNQTSIKFSQHMKDILDLIRNTINKNFGFRLKKKDILEFIFQFLSLDESFIHILHLQIDKESVNEPKITVIIDRSTKELFDDLILRIKYVEIKEENNQFVLQSMSEIHEHDLKSDEYINIFINIFQKRIAELSSNEIATLFHQINEKMLESN